MQANRAHWEEIFKSKEWGKYPSEPLIRFVAKHFYKAPNRKEIHILELGVGGGANMWYMAREGFSVSGIEWAQNGINQCLKRFESDNLMPYLRDIKCGDYILALDEFENESFDAWIDSTSLCCNDFDKTKTIIEKAICKLKKGGKFFSITPAEGTFGLVWDKQIGYHACYPIEGCYADTGFVRYSTKEDMTRLYKGDNYEINTIYQMQTIMDSHITNALFIVEGVRIS